MAKNRPPQTMEGSPAWKYCRQDTYARSATAVQLDTFSIGLQRQLRGSPIFFQSRYPTCVAEDHSVDICYMTGGIIF